MDKVDCFFAIALVICFVMMVVTRHAEGDRETVRISVQSSVSERRLTGNPNWE